MHQNPSTELRDFLWPAGVKFLRMARVHKSLIPGGNFYFGDGGRVSFLCIV